LITFGMDRFPLSDKEAPDVIRPRRALVCACTPSAPLNLEGKAAQTTFRAVGRAETLEDHL
jgi:hypothetical protein